MFISTSWIYAMWEKYEQILLVKFNEKNQPRRPRPTLEDITEKDPTEAEFQMDLINRTG